MPSKNGVMSRSDTLTAAAPPADALGALRNNLLYSMLDAVSGDDLRAVIAKQVELARAGDHKAARLLVGMLATAPQFRLPPDRVPLGALRNRLVRLIACDGPLDEDDIGLLSHKTGVTPARLLEALDYPYFDHESDGWHVTAVGRATLPDRGDGGG